jgi:hypothetical protein
MKHLEQAIIRIAAREYADSVQVGALSPVQVTLATFHARLFVLFARENWRNAQPPSSLPQLLFLGLVKHDLSERASSPHESVRNSTAQDDLRALGGPRPFDVNKTASLVRREVPPDRAGGVASV